MAKSPRAVLHTARLADALLFWPVLALVIWGELQPGVPNLFQDLSDKVLHFGAYFVLGAMAGGAVKRRGAATWAVVGLIVLGAILEVIQAYVGRDMSLLDGLTNAAGAITGASLARFAVEPLRRRWMDELPENDALPSRSVEL